MNQPTKEQEQWFWEQCGWTYHPYLSPLRWKSPDGKRRQKPPLIDLNNLFKYAVPFLFSIMEPVEFTKFALEMAVKLFLDKDPSLALFWAIYRVLGGR